MQRKKKHYKKWLVVLLGCSIAFLSWLWKRNDLANQHNDFSPIVEQELEDGQRDQMTILTSANIIESKAAMPIYIVGAIKSPGVYFMQETAILKDLVQEAGGLAEDAAVEQINLAMALEAHQFVKIPTYQDVENHTEEGEFNIVLDQGKTAKQSGKININTADVAEMMTLSGIGEKKAEKIIAYRNEHGAFKTIEDLMKIPGIKHAVFDTIKDQITV